MLGWTVGHHRRFEYRYEEDEDALTKKYQNLLAVFNLIQIVFEPTRLTAESLSTITDHVN